MDSRALPSHKKDRDVVKQKWGRDEPRVAEALQNHLELRRLMNENVTSRKVCS